MKPLNNAERKAYRMKFIGMYSITIVLIIVVLSAFLQPAPATKTVIVEKGKPAKVITKTVYVKQKNTGENNFHEHDSLKAIADSSRKKVDELNADIQSQKNIIAQLQIQSATINKPAVKNVSADNELLKLKEQIKFYDWALRSQVVVTNTLTKENKSLKEKIEQLGKSQ